jgi:enoyl-CoA hydratase/carnithine racemase
MSQSASHMPITLADYEGRFQHIEFERQDGILQMRVHSEGGPLRWGRQPHGELVEAFLAAGRDRDNQVIILTGTGDEFSGPAPDPDANRSYHAMGPEDWGVLGHEAKHLLTNMLLIDVPMIAAVNGPARRHAELPIMCDIVLASETSTFQDSAHFVNGLVPGDGVHVAFPMAMGLNRARYFLLTGQEIGAREAKDIGLVNEVLPQDRVLPRAWDLARMIMRQPELNRRYTRILLTEQLRRQMNDLLPYGLALEGLAITAIPRK